MESLYQMAHDLTVWAYDNKRAAAEVILVIALLVVSYRFNAERQKLLADAAKSQGLAADLSEQLTLKNNELTTVKRDSEGKIVYKDVYVPPEGYVTISEKDRDQTQQKISALTDQLKAALAKGDSKDAQKIEGQISDANNSTIVTVHDHGFTVAPGFGLDWANNGTKIHADVKWYYWGRWGALLGGSANGVGPGISRHLDDVLPWHPRNLEYFVNYNFILNAPGRPISTGFRVGF